MFVPNGSFLTWIGTFTAWSYDTISVDDAIIAVSTYLKNNYNLVVTGYDSELTGDVGAGALTLNLQSNMDRGNVGSDDGVADIKSNVDDAFTATIRSQGNSITIDHSQCTMNVSSQNNAPTASGPVYSFSFRNLLPSWLGGSPVTPEQQAQYTAQGRAQVGNVATSAQTAYGAGSTTTSVARTAAAQQADAFTSDEAKLAAAQNKAAASSDQWILYGLIAAVVVVGAVVALPYIAAARQVTR